MQTSASSEFDYDLFVIGGGSGGVRAARTAAGQGLKVAIAEDTHWGGTCVNVGCVPKKLMVYASHFSHDFEDAQAYGWSIGETSFNWKHFVDAKNKEISRLNGIYVNLLTNTGVEQFNAFAKITGEHQVSVDGKTYSAERILIAVGGTPFVPQFPGSQHVITSDQIFFMEQQPKSVVVVGGGYIALEFACILKGLGTQVTLVYRGDLFLRGFDSDVRQYMLKELIEQGIDVRLSTDVTSVEQGASSKTVSLTDGSSLEVDSVFYATGRIPRLQNLFDGIQVETDKKGQVVVDNNFQSSVPSIYALGDVVGRMTLTPVATAEAMALVKHIKTGQPVQMDYQNIPTAIFTQPNIGTVGLGEEQVKAAGYEYLVYETDFRYLKHTLTGRNTRVYMKMIVDKPSQAILGCHIMGPEAGEMMQAVAVAIKAGATKADFDQTIGIHPTIAEELVTLRTPRSE